MRSSRQGLETEHARKERHGESERVRHAPLAAAITVDLGRDHLCWPPPAVARPAARPSSTSPLSVSRTQAASAGSPRHVLRGKSATVPSGAVERGGGGGTSWQTEPTPSGSAPPAWLHPATGPAAHPLHMRRARLRWEDAAAPRILVAHEERKRAARQRTGWPKQHRATKLPCLLTPHTLTPHTPITEIVPRLGRDWWPNLIQTCRSYW